MELELPHPLELEFELKPISLQAKSRSKAELRESVRTQIKHFSFLFSGEVEVVIEWLLHPKHRYEGIHSPDIDNILKPLIDALSGPDGILVNDCQVQSVRCSWIDRMSEDQKLMVTINYQPDEWILKSDLVWVEIFEKLCMPINEQLPVNVRIAAIEHLSVMFRKRRELIELWGKWEYGQYLSPIQMPFHRARLKGFNVVKYKSYLDALKSES